MLVYRIQQAKYAQSREDILSGEGAKRNGGRWNKIGTPLVYSCASPELAILETLVHISSSDPDDLPDFALITIQIPDESIIKTDIQTLPKGWKKDIYTPEIQLFTKNWLQEQKFLTMDIPSVLMTKSKNYLINPLHPEIVNINIIEVEDFTFDDRMIFENSGLKMIDDIFIDIIGFENQ